MCLCISRCKGHISEREALAHEKLQAAEKMAEELLPTHASCHTKLTRSSFPLWKTCKTELFRSRILNAMVTSGGGESGG